MRLSKIFQKIAWYFYLETLMNVNKLKKNTGNHASETTLLFELLKKHIEMANIVLMKIFMKV